MRSCKVLAARLGSEPLENWLLWESNGYPSIDMLPSYRVWPLVIRGNFSGVFQSMLKNARIPTASLPEDCRGRVDVERCCESVAAIQHLITETENEMIQMDLGDLALVLGTDVIDEMNCISAWGEFHKSRLVEVLNAVRNRVLDFALALAKEDPKAGEAHSSGVVSGNRVTQIFNTTVYGGAANVLGIAENSNLSLQVLTGDFGSLANYLKQFGIDDDDLRRLDEATKADPTPCGKGTWGPRVAAWIGEMCRKAATGAWTVALSSAGSMLARAIEKYYGLG